MPPKTPSAVLTVCCPDCKGLVLAVTEFILRHGGNILDLDQHVEPVHSVFFMRIEWELDGFDIARDALGAAFHREVAASRGMRWDLHYSDETPRMAIFVSRLSHCLYDLLSRIKSGEWQAEVPLIVSNHSHLEDVASAFGIDYHVLPVTPETKKEQEAKQLELIHDHDIEFVVLARYMQILSEEFVATLPERIINIHHSFLPAFPGAKPYHSAYERGVKVIGATSHYVTSELDAGPIIEQDVVHVSHRHSIQDLIRKGRDLEKVVLSRAVWNHISRRVIVHGNRTVVFG